MKLKKVNGIYHLNTTLEEIEKRGKDIKAITVMPRDADAFYIFYDDEIEKNYLRSKIIDFRNFLVREEKTFSDIIRSIEQERTYWQNYDSPASKRALDYLSWLKDQLIMSAIAVNEMMRETKEILMRRY